MDRHPEKGLEFCPTATLFAKSHDIVKSDRDSDSQGSSIMLLGARTLLGAKGIATRSKDATRGSWPYY